MTLTQWIGFLATWSLTSLAAWLVSLTMRPGKRYTHLRWDLVRAFIRKRDQYRCQECGRYAEYGKVWLEVHHLKHIEHGGGYGPRNLKLLCDTCHREAHK